jgi:hypothetical protein
MPLTVYATKAAMSERKQHEHCRSTNFPFEFAFVIGARWVAVCHHEHCLTQAPPRALPLSGSTRCELHNEQ